MTALAADRRPAPPPAAPAGPEDCGLLAWDRDAAELIAAARGVAAVPGGRTAILPPPPDRDEPHVLLAEVGSGPAAAARALRVLRDVSSWVGSDRLRAVVLRTDLTADLAPPWTNAEERRLADAAPVGLPVVVLRTGPVPTTRLRRRWGRLAPLLSELSAPFVTPAALAAFAAGPASAFPPGLRRAALLGPNRPWREALAEGAECVGTGRRGSALRWTGAGVAARAALRRSGLAFDTLRPRSHVELIELCRPWNRPHVRLAGYNNGVTHFGWRFPGKTVVSTVAAGGRVRVRGEVADVDAGQTLHAAAEALAVAGKRFHVLPNFSYVGAGTPFFVPVHGSGSAVSTLGDTIEDATFYDPAADRILRALRGEPAFDERMYDADGGPVLLRLRYRVRGPVRLRAESERLEAPSAGALWDALAESGAANVEVRKAKAVDTHVTVLRHHALPDDPTDAAPAGDDKARDRIGRLWDRLEETPGANRLFHWLVRRFGYHVELFLRPAEFETFWNEHRSLPLSKIQLRMVRGDGLPRSPVRDGDAVSVDLFMARKHRDAFRAFVRERLPEARVNPGKQSL